MELVSKGNNKLGKLPSFSLPAMKTCPGKTLFCERFCYGLKGRFEIASRVAINNRRLEATYRDDFVPRMEIEIIRANVAGFRLHVIGDFYSEAYIDKWLKIVEKFPNVAFFGSTRSWRTKLENKLVELRDMPNVFLKASIDLTHKDMPAKEWSIWSVEGPGAPCPHDKGLVRSCGICKKCWTDKNFNMSLNLRWGSMSEYLNPHSQAKLIRG